MQADIERDPLANTMTVNIGPSHPATHGTFRFLCELDGETIIKCLPEIGYLHRAFEKSAEKGTYTEVIPYTDRLNYCSAMMNNVGYCQAVEEFFEFELPERCVFIRMIVSEMSRIMDHLVCIGACAIDLGALTNFWYFFQTREEFYDLIEELCGARLTTTYTRVGGVMADLPDGWIEQLSKLLKTKFPKVMGEVDGLLTKNRIFKDRTIGVGSISAEDAVNWGFTGPCLRAAGVSHDLRKSNPYMYYDRFEFDVPVGEQGDTYDRYLVRMEEMRQSARLLEQLIAALPGGPVNADDPRVVLPPKDQVYGSIEGTIKQFELIIKGIEPPVGEVYSATEAANGELGFYIVSDGTGHPYRVRVRPPCFPIMSAVPHMVEGQMVADMVATLSSINIIAGELER